ncbi:WXG100 family type VII secretion target [Herbidospora daliensis]|uniref:WXG100 family type VII secretion target n=1 Tax=Herbidospora daliensis TaxID=295585 RepID=UPI000780A7A0|nr:WXG100 family type VII secretion target [Herbidospora daliensis]
MGQKFSITGDAVNKHGTNLDTSVNNLNANLRQFLAAVEALPGVWQGAAFQSFDQLTKRWETASHDLNSALTTIRGRVGNAGQLYDAYHAEQAAGISQTAASADWDGAKFRG